MFISALLFRYSLVPVPATLNHLSGPITSRRAVSKSVKFSLSSGLDLIPAPLVPGYSQSISIPSKSYCFISAFTCLAKLYLEAGVAAASENPS